MLTLIAFLLMIAGGVNWLLIGLLQYDFIAGFFGFQASMFSRLTYILFGIGSAYIVIRTIANKGSVRLFERKKKKQKQAPLSTQNKQNDTQNTPSASEIVDNGQNRPNFALLEDKTPSDNNSFNKDEDWL